MSQEISQPLDATDIVEARPFAFKLCLALSLLLHGLSVLVVMIASTSAGRGGGVQYIDLSTVPTSTPTLRAKQARVPAPAPPREMLPEIPPKPVEAENAENKPATIDPTTAEVLKTTLGRGMASGYFSSLAQGQSLRDDIREYYFNLLEQINAKWWAKAETLTESAYQDGILELTIRRDGELVNVVFGRGTGSREVDRAIAEVLTKAGPFPPLPERYDREMFQAPLKISAPSNLFRILR